MTLRWLERLLVIVGVGCLGWVGTTWVEARMFQEEQSRTLDRAIDLARISQSAAADSASGATVRGPVGRLEIPRLDVSVVVMPGEDEETLQNAVGHLSDTPMPWNGGNTALAGHRDTFFRALEHVTVGDDIHFDTPPGRFRYRVLRTVVVEPEELWVLDPSAKPTLTLITCYPFRFVGPAPKRFIVQAQRV